MHGAERGQGGFIADWIGMLDEVRGPIAHQHGTEGRHAEREMELAAVRVSLANLMTFPCIQAKVAKGSLKLRGAFFAISDGILHVMDDATGEFAPVE